MRRISKPCECVASENRISAKRIPTSRDHFVNYRLHNQICFQEILELRSKEVTVVDRDQYKSDLAAALVEIRRDFEALNNKKKTELASWYSRKVSSNLRQLQSYHKQN